MTSQRLSVATTETAEVGEVFDGKGVIIVVRLKEADSDFEV